MMSFGSVNIFPPNQLELIRRWILIGELFIRREWITTHRYFIIWNLVNPVTHLPKIYVNIWYVGLDGRFKPDYSYALGVDPEVFAPIRGLYVPTSWGTSCSGPAPLCCPETTSWNFTISNFCRFFRLYTRITLPLTPYYERDITQDTC
jgi:hypothetical protein